MTHVYSAVALPKKEMNSIHCFTGITPDIEDAALQVFDNMLAKDGPFNVFQTYFTDQETKERMVNNNAFSHEGELVDYKAYVTWKNTIHLRFEGSLKSKSIDCRNPFLDSNAMLTVRRAIVSGVSPKQLSDANYSLDAGCVFNNNA
jgi:hypothetical protein